MRRIAAVVLLAGCGAPQRVYERPIDQAIEEGVAFLVRTQRPDGSWGLAGEFRGWEIGQDSVPGAFWAFRDASTALAFMALREAGESAASRRALDYLVHKAYSRRTLTWEIYNIWAHVYGLHALSLALQDAPGDGATREAAARELDLLRRYESYLGGWNYYSFEAGTKVPAGEPTSFTTGAALVALWEARKAGLDVPQAMVDRALRRMAAMRRPDGGWLYGFDGRWGPGHDFHKPEGSIGRGQAANFAMWLWKHPRVGEKEARHGLEMFFEKHLFIEIGRKRQFPHEAWFATAPYYFYFGHYYAARLVERLPEFRARLRGKILPHQEPDGSWWDYPMYDIQPTT